MKTCVEGLTGVVRIATTLLFKTALERIVRNANTETLQMQS